MKLATAGTADYLIAQGRTVLFEIFFSRGNTPLEFSALRLALEAHGVKASDSSHWGILAATLKNDTLIEAVGRELAVVASRNGAKNQSYRLSKEGYAFAKLLGEKKRWDARDAGHALEAPRQESLL